MSWQLAARSCVLAFGEGFLGNIGEDHAVIRLELGQVGGKRVAADAARAVDLGRGQYLDLDLFFAKRLDERGMLTARSLDQEHLGLAAGVRKPFGDVVDGPLVAATPGRV